MTGLPRGSVPAALPPPPSSDQREVTSWLKSRSVVSRTITEIGRGACHHRPMADVTRPRRREAYAERFARGDSYGLLLALLLVLYVVMAATHHQSLWGRWAISMLLGAVMLLTLHTSHVRSRGFHVGIAIVLIAETSNLLQAVFNESTGTGATFLMFLLVLAAPVVILNRILRHETVGLETILGAICIYVLIAIAFSGLYAWVNEVEPTRILRAAHPEPAEHRLPLLLVRHHHHRRLRRPHRGHEPRPGAGDVRGHGRPDLPGDPGGAPGGDVRRHGNGRRPTETGESSGLEE